MADYDSVLLRRTPPPRSSPSLASELLPELLSIIFELVAQTEDSGLKDDSSLRALCLVSKRWSQAATSTLYRRLDFLWDPSTALLVLRTFRNRPELGKIPRELVVNRPGDVQLWTGFEVPGTVPAKDEGMGRFRANAGANEGQEAFFLWLKELESLTSLAIRGFSLYVEGVLDEEQLQELEETLQTVKCISVATCTVSLASTLMRSMGGLEDLHLHHSFGSLPGDSPFFPPFSLRTLELDQTDLDPGNLLHMVTKSRSLKNLTVKRCRNLSSLDVAAALTFVAPCLRTLIFHPHIPFEEDSDALLRVTPTPSYLVAPTFLAVLQHCTALRSLELFDWPFRLLDFLPRNLLQATFLQPPPTPQSIQLLVTAVVQRRLEGELLELRMLMLHGFTGKKNTRTEEQEQLGFAWGEALEAGVILSFIESESLPQ